MNELQVDATQPNSCQLVDELLNLPDSQQMRSWLASMDQRWSHLSMRIDSAKYPCTGIGENTSTEESTPRVPEVEPTVICEKALDALRHVGPQFGEG
jgi:hypothetical protein